MRVSVLSSGSKGNSTLIESSDSSLLIDSGLSAKQLKIRICKVGGVIEKIKGILITHDHTDHVSGAGVIARNLKIPVYIHKGNYENKKHIFKNCEIHIIKESEFVIGDLNIEAIEVSHDGTVNHGYSIINNGRRISQITDLGIVTTLIIEKIQKSNLLILESNHDPEMLFDGPYPWELKQRVTSRFGHLSNQAACDVLKRINSNEFLHTVILAHLSEENNNPKLAYDMMYDNRDELGFHFDLLVAKQHEPLEFIEV